MNDTVEFLSITTEMVQFDGIRENNENVQGHSVNSSSKMRIRLSYWIHLSLENIDCFSIGRWNFNFRHFFVETQHFMENEHELRRKNTFFRSFTLTYGFMPAFSSCFQSDIFCLFSGTCLICWVTVKEDCIKHISFLWSDPWTMKLGFTDPYF